MAAHDLEATDDVMDWLWEFDSSYGRVELLGARGRIQLEPESVPFQPDLAAAVKFAQEQVRQTGSFTGYLPEGSYAFGAFSVRVRPRVATTRVDARGDRGGAEVTEAPAKAASGGRTTEVALLVGNGHRYGTIAGAGFLVAVRPLQLLGFEAGVGYDVPWTRPGLSAAARVHPVEGLYLSAGVAPVVWYRGVRVGGSKVSHGPTLGAGLDLSLGRLKVDLNLGGGFARLPSTVPDDQRSRLSVTYGLGLGYRLGGG